MNIKNELKWRARLALALAAVLPLSLFPATGAAWQQGRPAVQPPTNPTGQEATRVQPPVNKEILKVRLPRAKEATLKNGLRVIVLEGYNQLPTFTMQMVVLSGGLSDPPDRRGLANFTAALLREGTKTRTSREIADQLDSLGATLTTDAGLSSLTSSVTTSGLVKNFDRALDIFTDVIRNPSFPTDELEKYKTRTLAQLQLQRATPNFLSWERFNQAIYDEHPAGIVSPPLDSLQRVTSADFARFHSAHYLPNNAMLAVVGAVTLAEILPKIERVFGDWKSGVAPKTVIPPTPTQPAAKIYLIDRPSSVQTGIVLGNLGVTRDDPDYFALQVMDKIVGGGPAARLYLNLRQAHGYTYGAYSQFNSWKFRGTWYAGADVRTEVTEGAIKEFLYELKRVRDEHVTPAELDSAMRALVGSFALSLEQPQTLLQNIITQKLYNLSADYWDTYPQKVAGISAEDVQRAAQKYVDLAHLQIVAVGDASKIRDVLAKYGTVEAYDSEGKLIKATDSK